MHNMIQPAADAIEHKGVQKEAQVLLTCGSLKNYLYSGSESEKIIFSFEYLGHAEIHSCSGHTSLYFLRRYVKIAPSEIITLRPSFTQLVYHKLTKHLIPSAQWWSVVTQFIVYRRCILSMEILRVSIFRPLILPCFLNPNPVNARQWHAS